MALVCKLYRSSSEVVLYVRQRPVAANGGGFVVTNCSHTQKVLFKAEGCGTLGTKDKLLLRDAHGNALLLMRRNGGMVEALSMYRTWKGYKYDFQGSEEMVFRLKQPNCPILGVRKKEVIKIMLMAARSSRDHDDELLEVRGYFPDRKCSIVDSGGRLVAEIGAGEVNKEVYRVVVKPGVDQAFVCGVIAILDNLYGESTNCA